MSSAAWVVTCPACKCIIVAFARDPQDEHGKAGPLLPPASSCVLECLCCGSAYRYTGADFVAGVPKRNPACLRKQGKQSMDWCCRGCRFDCCGHPFTGEPINQSPKVVSTVADSIQLARMVVARMEK